MIPEYCKSVIRLLNNSGFEAYVVGGAVRDILNGITPHDFDVATSATPEETCEVLKNASIRTIIEQGIKHGTVTGIVDGNIIEITSFRCESGYSDNRRPDSVTFTRSIEEDVKRRDFTINAMYIDSENNIVDITNGREDLKAGIIRAVGNPYNRFNEDALRIMRALRFSARFGFKIEDETANAIHTLKDNLNNISVERIHAEFSELLMHKYASSVLREFHDVISVFVPELEATIGFDQHSTYHNLDVFEHTLKVLDGIPLLKDGKRDEAIAIAALFHDIGKPEVFYFGEDGRGHMKFHQFAGEKIAKRFCEKMKFSTKLSRDISELILLHDTFPSEDKKSVQAFLAEYSVEFSERLYILQRADILAHSKVGLKRLDTLENIIRIKDELVKEGACLTLKDLAVNGNDLKSFGITDGRMIGEMLGILFENVINGIHDNTFDACKKFIDESL